MLNRTRKQINHFINQYRLKKIAQKAQGKTLDVGCSSIQNEYLDPESTVGVDINIPPQARYKIVKADLNEKLPFSDNTFDTIIAGEVIEHLQNTTFILSELYRVLKTDGTLVVTVPNGWTEMILTALKKSHEHLIIFSPNLFKRLLVNANYKDIKFTRILKWYCFYAKK